MEKRLLEQVTQARKDYTLARKNYMDMFAQGQKEQASQQLIVNCDPGSTATWPISMT